MGVGLATVAAPLVVQGVSRLFGRRRKPPDINAIIRRYLAARPGGYTTEEDRIAAELTRSRGTRAAEEFGRHSREQAARDLQRRGILMSPAATATTTRIGQVEAGGRERAAEAASAQLYDAFGANRAFEQNKLMSAFGSEIGKAQADQYRGDAREATFWNSILDVVGNVAPLFNPTAAQPAYTGTSAATYDPTGGRPNRRDPSY